MDPRSQMIGSRGSSPKWMDSIPGYRGYKDKELRRDADRALRAHLAAKLETQHRRLDDVKRQLLAQGGLAGLAPFERVSVKLQTTIDTLKAASYGYAGLFDAAAIREAQLDALYAFDQHLDQAVDEIGAKVEALRAAVSGKVGVDHALDTLTASIDDLLTRIQQRHEAILSAEGLPAESPRAVLEAPSAVPTEIMALRNLRLRDAVAIAGSNYVVSAREQAFLNGVSHILFRLDSGSGSRWLWIGDSERDLAILETTTPSGDPFTADQLAIGGDTMMLVGRGMGSVALDGPSGSKRDVPAQIAIFRSDLQALWAEKISGEAQILSGLTIDAKTLQVFRR